LKLSISYNIVILAAGASSRLGRPKQLLSFNDESMLQHMINEAQRTSAKHVVVVLGANASMITGKVKTTHARTSFIVNDNWSTGIASSIHTGIATATQLSPDTDGVVLMVCDQPFVKFSHLQKLVEAHRETRKPIVASHYQGAAGTPVFFNSRYYDDLLKLEGDTGAKKIIAEHKDDVFLVEFAGGEVDIDTEEDYKRILNQ
jgi:molybdenum cofactor cytidylyltransferase